ncbi:MAG: alpha/beta hydrolase [Planctomycetota bacterium]|nr:alpha/beta hydrolase [Planctomycetota bacterium]MDA1212942.1 alpha/beta hydrolase [Planctomycetota bacterium]
MITSRMIVGLFVASMPLGLTTDVSAQLFSSSSLSSSSQKAKKPKTTRSLDEMLLFYPSKFPAGNWEPDKLNFEDAWFKAADGNRVHAWYCPCDEPRATILLAHGNGGNIASRASWLTYLQQELRVTTLMFDYRGYGRSPGVPTVEGALQDARAARVFLASRAGVEEPDIYLMGESLGGAIVVQLAAEAPPRGLILQSTFSSLRDIASVHYPALAWVVPKSRLNSAAQLAGYKGPLLQSHGDADGTIPFSSGEALFNSANEPKTFLKIKGADHNNWLSAEYARYLDAFIENVETGSE